MLHPRVKVHLSRGVHVPVPCSSKFGSFQGVPRAGGSIRSMHGAKEMIEYPASTLVKFKAGTGFKAAVKAPNE